MQIECMAWAIAVGAAIAGGGMYVDIRDNISEVLDDRWYFLRNNIWWIPYYAALIGAPLLAISAIHRRVAGSVQRMTQRKGYVAGDLHRTGDLSNPCMSTFLGAVSVASVAHTVIVNCVWSTLCERGEWGGTLLMSPLFFGVPLGLMMLRRALWKMLRP